MTELSQQSHNHGTHKITELSEKYQNHKAITERNYNHSAITDRLQSRNYSRQATIKDISQKGHFYWTITKWPHSRNYHREATITELSQKGNNYGAIKERPQSQKGFAVETWPERLFTFSGARTMLKQYLNRFRDLYTISWLSAILYDRGKFCLLC